MHLDHSLTPSTFTIHFKHNDDDKEEERKEDELARYVYDRVLKVIQNVIDTPVESPSETLFKKEIVKKLQRLLTLIPVKDIKK